MQKCLIALPIALTKTTTRECDRDRLREKESEKKLRKKNNEYEVNNNQQIWTDYGGLSVIIQLFCVCFGRCVKRSGGDNKSRKKKQPSTQL